MNQTINTMLAETTETTHVDIRIYTGLLSQYKGSTSPEVTATIVDSNEMYMDIKGWENYPIEENNILHVETQSIEDYLYETGMEAWDDNIKDVIVYVLFRYWRDPPQEQLEDFIETLEACQKYENYVITASHDSHYDKDMFLVATPEEREEMLETVHTDLYYLESIEEWASLLTRARTKFANDKDMLEFIEECDENWDFMNDDEVMEFRRATDIWE